MYEVIKSVILTGRFELADMLKKIDTIWLQGAASDEQRIELMELARNHAEPENSYASLQNQISSLFTNLAEQATAIKDIYEKLAAMDSGEVTPPIIDEYPEYVQPTGAHDAYMVGDKVTFDGNRYVCVAPEGVAVVWDPHVMPSYWQEVTEN